MLCKSKQGWLRVVWRRNCASTAEIFSLEHEAIENPMGIYLQRASEVQELHNIHSSLANFDSGDGGLRGFHSPG